MSDLNQKAYSTITSDEEKLKIGNQFLTALKNRDWDLLRSIITPDVNWTLPGNNPLSGEYNGAEAIINKARQIVEYNMSLELNHVLYSLNGVALVIHNQATRGNLILDEHLATVCVLRDGKISSINTFFSDTEGMDKFFMPSK